MTEDLESALFLEETITLPIQLKLVGAVACQITIPTSVGKAAEELEENDLEPGVAVTYEVQLGIDHLRNENLNARSEAEHSGVAAPAPLTPWVVEVRFPESGSILAAARNPKSPAVITEFVLQSAKYDLCDMIVLALRDWRTAAGPKHAG